MKLKSLFLTLLFFCTFAAKADYSTIYLPELINRSDIIVYGTVVHVGEKFFTIKIEGIVKGDYKDSTIIVRKFEEWTCGFRFQEYKVGQREFAFIYKGINGGYGTPGLGNEGEVPIFNNKVYYGFQIVDLPNLKEYLVYGYKMRAIEYTINDFIKVIKAKMKEKH